MTTLLDNPILDDTLANRFEERAEHLSREELESWTAHTVRDAQLLEKLKNPGLKLLSGPRGSGKSTLLRRAYFELLGQGEVLAVYVNYSKSLALEPLFHKQANALQLFRQWVIAKIVTAVAQSYREMKLDYPDKLRDGAQNGDLFIRKLEIGDPPGELLNPLAPSELLELLEEWTDKAGCKRCVLFLDDAAHAFSPEQQRDFFEVFRELRSRRVSGKAAVYPGITAYSPNFHVGHEAELLEAWYRPEESEFLPLMRSIVQRRFPPDIVAQLFARGEIVDLLALASFGLPRGFLNMLSQVLESGGLTRSGTLTSISEHAEEVRGVFKALSVKLPRFKHFIEEGSNLENAMSSAIQVFNRDRVIDSKAVVIAIGEPIAAELDRILKLMEYAGLVRSLGTVSKGSKGVFHRYAVHYAILITENSLSLGKSYSISDLIIALNTRDAHVYVRSKPKALLGSGFENRCTLDLPPCNVCFTPRVAEQQRFCMKCGAELKNASVYDELLLTMIDYLPLTPAKVAGIKQHTKLRTVQDILLDDEQSVRSVPHIGEIWSARIKNSAEEFVSV